MADLGVNMEQQQQQQQEEEEVALNMLGAREGTGTEEQQLPYPDLPPVVFLHLKQTTKLRRWCIQITHSPWLDYLSILMILLSCITLCFYKPYEEQKMHLEICEGLIIVFFYMEMLVKMVALGVPGYFQNSWNQIDVFINCGEVMDYFLAHYSLRLEVFQALRPMRLCGRIPSLQILTSALVDTLPMLGNVLLINMLVIHIFSVVGVQLWAGELLNRCFLGEDLYGQYNVSLNPYYISKYGEKSSYVCASAGSGGMQHCDSVPAFSVDGETCKLDASHYPSTVVNDTSGCVNWNQYYNVCRPGERNPRMGVMSFDNIGYSWIAMFLVVTTDGWTEIMFYVMDANSFWSFPLFIFVTIIGAIIMMNVCAVVIATKFSEIMERNTDEQSAGASAIAGLTRRFTFWVQRVWNRSNQSRVHPDRRDRQRNTLVQISVQANRVLKKILNHAFFKGLMIFAVVLSILALVIEHHEQPKKMTYVLRIGDTIFTVIFLVEMILKLLDLKWQYFMDQNNVVDFVIVVTGLTVIFGGAKGHLPVLRSLRLLRFGRLLFYLPHVKVQLLVLKVTVRKASGLCILLLCFTFSLSILGMLLFGGKFVFETRLGDMVNARKNFDTLCWSMVTVFEVFTQDAWSQVLYNASAATSPWATLYFIVLIVIGKSVLLNVLVGIVIQSFEDISKPDDTPHTNDREEDGQLGACSDPRPSRASVPPDQHLVPPHGEEGKESLTLTQRIIRWSKAREDWAFYVLSPQNRFRVLCQWVISHIWFDRIVLFFILVSCVTVAIERPGIDPKGMERYVLEMFRYVLSTAFLVEMLFKVLALGLFIGKDSYCKSKWNILDGCLVVLSLVHAIVTLTRTDNTDMLSILKILRLMRALRPLRVIKRAPKLKLAVEALVSSVKPLGNIVLICCITFFFFAIIGVQLFKGKFFHCRGLDVTNITTKSECLAADYRWTRKTFNFDSVSQALMSLFVMYTKIGWVNIMYDGLDAVGVDKQPVRNYNEWMLLYFISFMILSYILLDMFIGVMVNTFHQCQQKQRAADALMLQEGGEGAQRQHQESEQIPYFANYSPLRRSIHALCVSSFLDLLVTAVIVLSVFVMAVEHHNQPPYVERIIEYSYFVFTAIFIMELLLKLVAFGVVRFMKDRWNLLDIAVVFISIVSIIFDEIKMADVFPINPSILRICRVLRLAQVLKTKKIRILLNTIIKTLSQVGHICLLFMFFFSIYAALGVELFGRLECTEDYRCLGLHRYANFRNFGAALLTLYRVCTGDGWSLILNDTLRECHPGKVFCPSFLRWASPIFFTSFVIMAQFVLANLVVASIMQALEDSNQEENCNDKKALTSAGGNTGPAPAVPTEESPE